MSDWGADWQPDDHDSPFSASDPGWTTGCRSEDRSWVTAYGFRPLLSESIANPVDVLPPGYPAYTAVLHSPNDLDDRDSDQRFRWVTDPTADAWDQVRYILDHGIGHERFAADNYIAQPEGGILADVLGLDTEDALLTVSYFFPAWIGTVRATTIATRLRTANHDVGYCPTFWFPHTRAWVASAPEDGGWTYVASTTDIAQQLRENPRIETLTCTYRKP